MSDNDIEYCECLKETTKQFFLCFTATINLKEMGDTLTIQTRQFIYISVRAFMPIGKFKHLQLCPRQMANKTSHKALSIL